MLRTNLLPVALATCQGALFARGADLSPLTHLSFQRSLQAGVRDANGKLITGTEVDFQVPHQDRLYASNCLWLETDSAVPKACQIFVLDSPKGQWRVEIRHWSDRPQLFRSLGEETRVDRPRGSRRRPPVVAEPVDPSAGWISSSGADSAAIADRTHRRGTRTTSRPILTVSFQGSFMHGQSRIVVVPFCLVFRCASEVERLMVVEPKETGS